MRGLNLSHPLRKNPIYKRFAGHTVGARNLRFREVLRVTNREVPGAESLSRLGRRSFYSAMRQPRSGRGSKVSIASAVGWVRNSRSAS